MENKFHLSAVLSVITNRLLVPRSLGGIVEVYDLLDFMTNGVFMKNMLGDNLHSYVFRRVCESCSPHLIRQFPQLAISDKTDLREEIEILDSLRKEGGEETEIEIIVVEWLKKQIKNHGARLVVEPIANYKPGGENLVTI